MSHTHGGAWGRKRKSACQGAAQVVVGMGVAAGEVGAAEPENGVDLIGRPALREQRPCHPQIHDAPVRRGEAFGNLPAVHPGLVDGGAWPAAIAGAESREQGTGSGQRGAGRARPDSDAAADCNNWPAGVPDRSK